MKPKFRPRTHRPYLLPFPVEGGFQKHSHNLEFRTAFYMHPHSHIFLSKPAHQNKPVLLLFWVVLLRFAALQAFLSFWKFLHPSTLGYFSENRPEKQEMSLDFFPFCDKISTIWKDIAETKRKRSPSVRGKRCKPPDELPQAISRVARDDRDGRSRYRAAKMPDFQAN